MNLHCLKCLRTPPPHEWIELAPIRAQDGSLIRVYKHRKCQERTAVPEARIMAKV